MSDTSPASDSSSRASMKLFWACFVALVATSFVFGVRANVIGELANDFGLSESQKGTILGVGLWPFAISIIIFSLIIDKIGYRTAAFFAIGCHLLSLILTVMAKGYLSLYWATFLIAIANGTVEAFINPVVATAFREEKTKWLNILHAGWPAGLALGALFTILLGESTAWQVKIGMCFVPVIIYAFLIAPCKFPVQERVAAGVSYRDMLREVGGIGFFIIGGLLVVAVVQLYAISFPDTDIKPSASLTIGVAAGIVTGIIGAIYTRSAGNWMFLVILLTMGPLATTELGTDSWMPDLLKGAGLTGTQAGWVFIYVSTVMTILRFYAGPIVHRFSPIGLLVISAVIAIIGLLFLSQAVMIMVVVAATVYAFGKTFLWSTTLGLVSEQFPKGGALTLNGVSAVGVLGMGIIGTPFMGVLQDQAIDRELSENHPALHQQVQGDPKVSIFGEIPSIDFGAAENLAEAEAETLANVQKDQKRASFAKIAVLPGFMLICYLGLFLYFRARGGYKPVEIGGAGSAAH